MSCTNIYMISDIFIWLYNYITNHHSIQRSQALKSMSHSTCVDSTWCRVVLWGVPTKSISEPCISTTFTDTLADNNCATWNGEENARHFQTTISAICFLWRITLKRPKLKFVKKRVCTACNCMNFTWNICTRVYGSAAVMVVSLQMLRNHDMTTTLSAVSSLLQKTPTVKALPGTTHRLCLKSVTHPTRHKTETRTIHVFG